MTFGLVVVLLALIWVAVTDGFTLLNLLFGALIGLAALWLVRDRVQSPLIFSRVKKAVALAGLFFKELLISALRVSALVLAPNVRSRLRPAIVAFPLAARKDVEITLLANLVTLTPGTLSIDVSDDRRFLYVHALSVPDREALVADIREGFERRVIEVIG